MLPSNEHYYKIFNQWIQNTLFLDIEMLLGRVLGKICQYNVIMQWCEDTWFSKDSLADWLKLTGDFCLKKNKKVSCRICSIWLPIRHHLLKIQWHQVKSFPWKQIFFLLNKEKRSNLIILLQDIPKLIVGFWSPHRKTVECGL